MLSYMYYLFSFSFSSLVWWVIWLNPGHLDSMLGDSRFYLSPLFQLVSHNTIVGEEEWCAPSFLPGGVEVQVLHLGSLDIWEGRCSSLLLGGDGSFSSPLELQWHFLLSETWGALLLLPPYSLSWQHRGGELITVAGMKVPAVYSTIFDTTQSFFVVFPRVEWLLSKFFLSC